MNTSFWKMGVSSVLCIALTSLLSACGSGGDGGGNTGGDPPLPPASTSLTRIQDLVNAIADTDPIPVTDPVGLQQDLNSVFGQADSDPIEVNGSDNAAMVVQHLAGQ